MNKSVAKHCDQCHKYGLIILTADPQLVCPHCQAKWGVTNDPQDIFAQCPVCTCRQFYLSKDFNQFVGCLVMVLGIIFVPFTYGLSLPFFALIDWLLYRKVADVINCYRCGCEFRGFKEKGRFKPFMHHIGLKYDKYR